MYMRRGGREAGRQGAREEQVHLDTSQLFLGMQGWALYDLLFVPSSVLD